MRKATARRLWLGGVGVALLGAGAACQVVLGLDEPKQGVLPVVVDPCMHAAPPGPPDGAPRGPEANYWLVMAKIDFPATLADGGPRGFDLDEACTCAKDLHDGAPPCRSPGTAPACDPSGGIDNIFAETLIPYQALFDLKALSAKFGNTGGRGILMHLAGYNGEADDDDISLSIVPTEGLYSNLGCDELPRPDAALANPQDPYYVPTHDGCDHWNVKQGTLKASNAELVPLTSRANKGWVRGGQLVVPAATTVVPLAGRLLEANDTILTGRLEAITVAGKRVFRITDGLAGGRVSIASFVPLIGYTVVNAAGDAGNKPLCTNGLWPQVKDVLCNSLDTTASAKVPFGTETCNAFSVAWAFTGYPARIDDVERDRTPEATGTECEVITTPEELCRISR